VGPRVGVDAMAERKSPRPYGGSNPARSARSLVTVLTDLARLLIALCMIYFVRRHVQVLQLPTRS